MNRAFTVFSLHQFCLLARTWFQCHPLGLCSICCRALLSLAKLLEVYTDSILMFLGLCSTEMAWVVETVGVSTDLPDLANLGSLCSDLVFPPGMCWDVLNIPKAVWVKGPPACLLTPRWTTAKHVWVSIRNVKPGFVSACLLVMSTKVPCLPKTLQESKRWRRRLGVIARLSMLACAARLALVAI